MRHFVCRRVTRRSLVTPPARRSDRHELVQCADYTGVMYAVPENSSFDYLVADHLEPPRKLSTLGDLLVADGVITQGQLETALERQRTQTPAVNLYELQEDGIAKALLGLTTLEQVIRQAPRVSEQRSLDQILAFAMQPA